MDNDRKAVYDYIMNADGLIKMSTFAIFDGVVNKDYVRSEEHTSELQSRRDLVCRLLLEKKKCWAWAGSRVPAGLRRVSCRGSSAFGGARGADARFPPAVRLRRVWQGGAGNSLGVRVSRV